MNAMNVAERFWQGLTWDQFLAGFQMAKNRQRVEEIFDRVAVGDDDREWFRRLQPLQLKALVLAADWCPDVFQHLPVLMRLAPDAGLTVRIFDRDRNPDLRDRWAAWDGKHRIPVFVFFDSAWREVGRWYERTRRADLLLEEGRALLPPKDDPQFDERSRELHRRMGEEYRQGHLYQETVRELREVLSPLLSAPEAAGRTVRALDLFPHRNDFRNQLWPALRKLTAEQLEWKPAGSQNSIASYLRHLAQAEDWFLNRVIGPGPFAPKRRSELASLESMLAYLQRTRQQTEALLAEWTLEKLATETRRLPLEEFRGFPFPEPTLLWCFHRIFWHEVYHSSQILLAMRLQGVDPPLI